MNRDQVMKTFGGKIHEIPLPGGEKLHIKNLKVSDTNFLLYEDRKNHIKYLEFKGINTDGLTEKEVNKLIADNPSPDMVAKLVAMRLCDENGKLLFDVRNADDIRDINELDEGIINAIAGFEDNKKN